MKARVLLIKKSSLLYLSLAVNILLFIIFSLSFCLTLENYNLWFFFFCLFVGAHLINKSLLFKFDSSCFFGAALLLIGLLYFVAYYFQIINFYSVFLLVSFSFASFSTYIFFQQNFQLALSLSLFFVSIGLLLYKIKLISFLIFLAIIGLSMILLIVRYFTLNRSK